MSSDSGDAIQFFYDFISPASYLAFKGLPAVAEKHGARIDYRPVLLGGVHQAVGHKAAVEQAPSKVQWMMRDLSRAAARMRVPFVYNPHFPFLTVAAMRGALVAKERGELDRYNTALFDATWAEQEMTGNPAVLEEVLGRAGLDVATYAAGMHEPQIKERLKSETAAAVEAGVFGAPSFIVKGELVFGQDRLYVVDEILAE